MHDVTDLTAPTYTPNRLLNFAAEALGAPDDAMLALMLDVPTSQICRVRKHRERVSPRLMVRIADRTEWTIKRIRELAGMEFDGSAVVVLAEIAERRLYGRRTRAKRATT